MMANFVIGIGQVVISLCGCNEVLALIIRKHNAGIGAAVSLVQETRERAEMQAANCTRCLHALRVESSFAKLWLLRRFDLFRPSPSACEL